MAVRSIKPRGKNIGIFSSSNEARRASSHGKAIRRLARTFGVGPNEKRLFNELTTGEQRRILIENKVIEPVKTRRQRITESLRKIVRRPKETPPHLLRYRATSKTKYRYPFDVMLEKGVSGSWHQMSRKRQDTYAKVVLQHVIETTPALRRDPEILVMRNAVHHYLLGYGRRLQEMEKDAKLKEVTGGERFKTALERTRNAYSVLLGIREGLKTDRFVHLKF